jgi:hypothetical protein
MVMNGEVFLASKRRESHECACVSMKRTSNESRRCSMIPKSRTVKSADDGMIRYLEHVRSLVGQLEENVFCSLQKHKGYLVDS